jgi:hypothetical protein
MATLRSGAEAAQLHRALHAPMRDGRGIRDELGRLADEAALARRASEPLRLRDEDGEEIRHRGPGDEDARRGLGETEQLAHPAHDLALDLDRRVVASADVRVQTARQHLGEHAGERAAAMDPAEESRMRVAGSVRHDQALEVGMHVRERCLVPGHGRLERAADVGRHRPPDRARRRMLEMIDHAVEHRVRFLAKGVERRWIQRRQRPLGTTHDRESSTYESRG